MITAQNFAVTFGDVQIIQSFFLIVGDGIAAFFFVIFQSV